MILHWYCGTTDCTGHPICWSYCNEFPCFFVKWFIIVCPFVLNDSILTIHTNTIFHYSNYMYNIFRSRINQDCKIRQTNLKDMKLTKKNGIDETVTDSLLWCHCAPLILYYHLNDFCGFLVQNMDFSWVDQVTLIRNSFETANWNLIELSQIRYYMMPLCTLFFVVSFEWL